MTTLDLIAQLGPYVVTADVGTLPGPLLTAVTTAINAAQAEWAKAAPPAARQMRAALVFDGPALVTVTVINGSQAITGVPGTGNTGKQIVLSGDGIPNTLTAATTLALPYGGTSGTIGATLYNDAQALPDGFELLSGPVWLEDVAERRHLAELPDLRRAVVWPTQGGAARIEGYSIELGATSSTVGPVMRLCPMPAKRTLVSFEYAGRLPRWVRADLRTARTLPLLDDDWSYILPLVLRQMLGVPGLGSSGGDAAVIAANATAALESIRHSRRVPGNRPMTIGSQRGW